MKEEVLESIRKTFERLTEQRKESKIIWDRIDELEQNDLIKEYIELKSKVSRINPRKKYLTDDEILEISLEGNIIKANETNNIYVCLGTIKMSNQKYYKRYMNLEDRNDSYLISINNCQEFEQTHTVILLTKNNQYNEIRKEFERISLEEGQEKAYCKILRKNTKNKGE